MDEAMMKWRRCFLRIENELFEISTDGHKLRIRNDNIEQIEIDLKWQNTPVERIEIADLQNAV